MVGAIDIVTPLTKHYETCVLHPYQNPGDRPTIGWGNTYYEDGSAVTLDDDPLTQDQADVLFVYWLNDFMVKVASYVPGATANELAAFTDLTYNIGISAFTRSSALRAYLRADKTGAVEGIELWNEADGRVEKGLQRRRRAERYVFEGSLALPAIAQAERDFP